MPLFAYISSRMASTFEEIFIDAPWGKLATVCAGNKKGPPVLMVHGNLDTASTFFPLIEFFPRNLRLIMLELPGCGKSTPYPPGLPIYFMDFVHCLKLAVDHFALEKFTYIAHSMGFQIGIFFNEVYPDMIERFIALDNLTYPPVEPDKFGVFYKFTVENFYLNYKKFTSTPESGPLYTYEKALSVVTETRKLTKKAGEAVLRRALIPSGNGLFRFCWDQRLKTIIVPYFNKFQQIAIFGKVNIPHLVVFASESVESRLAKTQLHVLEAHMKNPNFRVALLEGCHDNHLNNPEEVAKLVVPFLLGEDYSKDNSEETIRYLHKMYYELQAKSKSKL